MVVERDGLLVAQRRGQRHGFRDVGAGRGAYDRRQYCRQSAPAAAPPHLSTIADLRGLRKGPVGTAFGLGFAPWRVTHSPSLASTSRSGRRCARPSRTSTESVSIRSEERPRIAASPCAGSTTRRQEISRFSAWTSHFPPRARSSTDTSAQRLRGLALGPDFVGRRTGTGSLSGRAVDTSFSLHAGAHAGG